MSLQRAAAAVAQELHCPAGAALQELSLLARLCSAPYADVSDADVAAALQGVLRPDEAGWPGRLAVRDPGVLAASACGDVVREWLREAGGAEGQPPPPPPPPLASSLPAVPRRPKLWGAMEEPPAPATRLRLRPAPPAAPRKHRALWGELEDEPKGQDAAPPVKRQRTRLRQRR
eukprot:TRINITY_DN6315_c1_g1_i1.p2 TRINITY_DN6315_c1_g1~~TRINITY_DN6315_c1_g1_i1.p2  ORF type:complete len:189 (+),score=84.34 TRINITY_DN6315_c1_g1_i1:46-567(+)